MLTLGIETSGPRASVALVRGGRLLGSVSRDARGQHAETLLDLVEELLDAHGVARGRLEKVAVGRGPGSFVGLRVGLSFGGGVALGLGVPVVGISSLRSLAEGFGLEPTSGEPSAVRRNDARARLAVVDARRDEFFVAAYAADGTTLVEPRAIAQASLPAFVSERFSPSEVVVLGASVDGYAGDDSPFTTTPHAACTALLGEDATSEDAPALPEYLRDADAVRPDLPASPLDKPRV